MKSGVGTHLRRLKGHFLNYRVRYVVLNRPSSHFRAGNGNSFAQAINLVDKASEAK